MSKKTDAVARIKAEKESFKIPLLLSKESHDKNRVITVIDCVLACHRAGKRCPDEWIKEIGDINKTFAK